MRTLREAVIVDAVRTPTGRGREGGALSELHPVDLFALVLAALPSRSGIDPTCISDVIGGNVTQVGEQGGNITRQAVLAAGYPERVPATTVDRKCGSSQQAVHFAAQGVMAGAYDLVVAGGVEMLSRVRMQSNTAGADHLGEGVRTRYPQGLVNQGIAAERMSRQWDVTREEADSLALESHRRAQLATVNGWFAAELLPIQTPSGAVVRDEGIRPTTTMEQLAALAPAFNGNGAAQVHPDLPWIVTAGNSSQISDGASAVLIASRDVAEAMWLRPRARFVDFAVVGDDPTMMLTAVMPATREVLSRAGMDIDDIDLFEVNEAFASVVVAWEREFGVAHERVNVNGGAIALGHPLGCSGTRLMTTLLHELERRNLRYGLQVMCEAGGQANATIIERL